MKLSERLHYEGLFSRNRDGVDLRTEVQELEYQLAVQIKALELSCEYIKYINKNCYDYYDIQNLDYWIDQAKLIVESREIK